MASTLRSDGNALRTVAWAEAGLCAFWALIIGLGLANEAEDYQFLPIIIAIFISVPLIVALVAKRLVNPIYRLIEGAALVVWPVIVWKLTWSA